MVDPDSRHAVFAWALLPWLLLADEVVAQPASPRGPMNGPAPTQSSRSSIVPDEHVQITLIGPVGEAEGFHELLTEWFGASESPVRIQRQPSLSLSEVLTPRDQSDILPIWVTLPRRDLARLYLADRGGQRYLVRDVPLRNALDELGREHVAQVLVTSVEDFVSRGVHVSREEVSRSFERTPTADDGSRVGTAPPRDSRDHGDGGDPSQPAVASPWLVRMGTFYSVRWKGAEGVGHGPGLLLGLGYDLPAVRMTVSVKGQLELPHEALGDRISLSLRTTVVRLALAIENNGAKALGGGLELGVGVDRVDFTPSSLPTTMVVPSASAHDWRPVATFALRVFAARESLRATLWVGASALLADTHYDVMVGEARSLELAPFLVQPGLGVEASWR